MVTSETPSLSFSSSTDMLRILEMIARIALRLGLSAATMPMRAR
jgi:hypothetical protein